MEESRCAYQEQHDTKYDEENKTDTPDGYVLLRPILLRQGST